MPLLLLIALAVAPASASRRVAAQGQRVKAVAPALPAASIAAAPQIFGIPGVGMMVLPGVPTAELVRTAEKSDHGPARIQDPASKKTTATAELRKVTQKLPASGALRNELDLTAPLDGVFDGKRPSSELAGAIGGVLRSELGALGPRDENPAPAPKDEPPAPKAPAAWRAWPANAATFLNLFSGIGAILAASSGSFALAAGLIGAAAVFDLLDGRLARALRAEGPLGVQLDSLADVVSFGAAPAILAFKAGLEGWGALGFVPAAVFAAAGAFRLARFNVGVASPKPSGNFFTGMPIPLGAGLVVAAALALPLLPAAWAPAVLAATSALAATAMASRIPYPSFKKGGFVWAALAALVAAAVPVALGAPLLAPAAVAGLYLLTGPAVWLYNGIKDSQRRALFRAELKRKVFHISAILLAIPAFYWIGYPTIIAPMAVFVGAMGLVEYQRLKARQAWPWRMIEPWLGGLVRASESDRPSGSFYASLGLLAAFTLYGFNPALVVAGVLALALGDSASPLVGLRFGWGRFTVRGATRSVDGMLAGFAVALAIGVGLGFSPLVAALAAVAFTFVDVGVVPVKPDDNFWIPVVFPGALLLFSRLLG